MGSPPKGSRLIFVLGGFCKVSAGFLRGLCRTARKATFKFILIPMLTFHYFGGVLWKAFGRGQLLGNRVAFDDVALLLGATLGSLPSGTAA